MIYNKHQNAELIRGETFLTYMELIDNKNIYSSYLPLSKKYTKFKTHFAQFQVEATNKGKSKAGTVTKAAMKLSIAKRLGAKLESTKDYAIESNNDGLKILVSFTEYEILKMKEGDILPLVQNLSKNVFTPALFSDKDFMEYNITALDISTILADAVLYNSNLGKVNTEDNSSSSANDNMDALIIQMHLDFNSMDINVKEFSESNPEFVAGYHKNKVLVETGIRHEGITGIVRKNGVIQPAAMIEEVGKNKISIADNDALYRMYLKPGKHTIQAKNENGDAQTKEVTVEQRKMGSVDFDLE